MKTIDKIREYYRNPRLEVLDNGTPHGIYATDKYLAVSLDYIHKYVLNEKVTKRFVARTLFKLCKNREITPIPCDHAGNLVFCDYLFQTGRFICKYRVEDNHLSLGFLSGWKGIEKYANWLEHFNSFL